MVNRSPRKASDSRNVKMLEVLLRMVLDCARREENDAGVGKRNERAFATEGARHSSHDGFEPQEGNQSSFSTPLRLNQVSVLIFFKDTLKKASGLRN